MFSSPSPFSRSPPPHSTPHLPHFALLPSSPPRSSQLTMPWKSAVTAEGQTYYHNDQTGETYENRRRCLPFSRLRSSSSLCFSPSALCTSSFLTPALYSAAGRTRLLEPERSAPLSAVRTLFQERTRFLHTKRSQRRRTQRPGAAEVLRRTVIGRRRPRPNRCHKSQPEILSSPR